MIITVYIQKKLSVYTEKAEYLFLFKTEIGLSTPEDAERGELLFGFREATEVTDILTSADKYTEKYTN